MIDLRPIAYVVGRILIVFAILMLAPAMIDYRAGLQNGADFFQCAILTGIIGAFLALATRNALRHGLNIRQSYLLTVSIWGLVPMFAALPFYFGAPGLSLTDAYFEAVSGITSTGASVITGLDDLPDGMNLWRGLLNWLGGFGIVILALLFLPVMRIGGMQYFRFERYDTYGKALPRVTDIARQLFLVYAALTVMAMIVFTLVGMTTIDAIVNAMSAISTGGFSPSDHSFDKYAGAGEYAGAAFMILGALPFICYVQLVNGSPLYLWRDVQVRGFLRILAIGIAMVVVWRIYTTGISLEPAFRHTLFNLVSIMTGTGFSSGSFLDISGFVMIVAFVMGLIGGCSGSSTGALSVFRVQVAMAALRAQIKLTGMPNQISPVKYGGRTVEPDVLSSMMLFISGFILILGLLTVAMTLTGVDFISALFGIWATLGNVGYSYGPLAEETGKFDQFPTIAKWIMILAMLMGRLGLLAMLVLVLPRFWRQ